MTIWVDADACPRSIRDILCRAAQRWSIHCHFVANQAISLPRSRWLHSRQVAQGFDEADNEIARRCQDHDLVVTADIPLAAEVLANSPLVRIVTFHGQTLDADNIQQRLALRDFMQSMRDDYGQTGGGMSPFSEKDKKAFADRLDRYCQK